MNCTHPDHRWHKSEAECREDMAKLQAFEAVRQMAVPLMAVPTEGN